MTAERMRLAVVAAMLCIYVVWGTTFYAIAVGLQTLPPFILGAARFFLAGGLLYAWLRLRSPRPLAGLPTSRVMLAGVLYSGIGNGFLIWSQQGIPSGIAALIVASVPIVVALLDWAAFSHRRPAVRVVLGILIAATGVSLIVAQTKSFHGTTGIVFLAALLIGVTAWSTASLLQRDVVKPERLLAFSAAQMLTGAVFQLVLAVLGREWRDLDPTTLDASSFLSVAYLAVLGTALAQSCYFWLVARVPTEYVTTYALVNPVVAVFLGVMLLDEEFTLGVAFASVLVLAGVGVVLFQQLVPRLLERLSGARSRTSRKSGNAPDHAH
jgi:drug/metabolite transporter (DMT)-like permease